VADQHDVERAAAFIPEAWARRVASCGGVVHDVAGLRVCLTGVPMPQFNPTLVAAVPSDPDRALAAAERAYEGTGLHMGIDLEVSLHGSVRSAAERAGLTMVESRPGMTLPIGEAVFVDPPDGVEVVRVEDPRMLDRIAEVDAIAFGGDPARGFVPDAMLEDPAQRVYAARVDGVVVGSGECTVVDGVMGVFGIATLPDFRRRGIAAALTSRLIEDRADEIDLVCLDASELGQRVYERLGFRATSTWEVWVRRRT
jgi:ribosomal protein S18 acetylase RimI-like enzyme